MKSINGIGLQDVQTVYSGAEGELWEMIMGQQIHIGGMVSSMDLAEKAGISAGMKGVDLCCCNGAGMRFLQRFRGVSRMLGVDATQHVIDIGQKRCADEGFGDKIGFVLADVCETGLPANSADFVWGEDAWCYVVDKPALIAEAARITRPEGIIAFTDWIEGTIPMTTAESERFLKFMKFANMADLDGYGDLLRRNGCTVIIAEDTGRFSPCIDLYISMLELQLTYDAMRIVGFNADMMKHLAGEMAFTRQLAHAGKVVQGMFVARKL